MKPIPSIGSARRNQSGVSLIVVLLLLVILTLLGIASLRGAIMQERMAANTMARSMAFQVAEGGLRQAEIIARDGTITFPGSGCTAGRCKDASWMSTADFWTGGTYQTGSAISIGSNSITPKFIIEDFGKTSISPAGNCIDMSKPCMQSTSQKVYRITSQAATPTGAEVILQSLYRR
ncbi:MAG: pilus assembly PilX family protein [Thermomonas sp.]